MGQSAIANALKRKTSVGQRAREVQGLTPTRALRVALARAAGELWELPLSVTDLTHDLVAVEDLLGRFDEETLLLLLDGPDGVRGGMSVDRALLTSVTEVQTIGEVSARDPVPRAFTPTDAALFAPLADAMLERLDVSLNSEHHEAAACDRFEAAWALGYRFGAQVERTRALVLALEGEEFHLLRLEIDIAAGLRRGIMQLCLPARLAGEEHAADEADAGGHADALASVPTRLAAALPSLQLPLSRATSLAAGDVLPLGQDAIQNIVLQASDGQVIARCTLGKIGDMRALRLQARRGEAVPPAAAPQAEDAFSTGLRGSAPLDTTPETFVPHDRREPAPSPPEAEAPGLEPTSPTSDAGPAEEPRPFSPAAMEDEVLPDLPPLDFDTPPDADGDLPPLDTGNVNFE